MPDPFGGFGWICRHTPLPQCNLFFSQLWREDSRHLTTLFPSTSDFYAKYSVTGLSVRDDPNVQIAIGDAGAGVGADCVIAHVGHRGSIGDVALMVVSGLSVIMALGLAFLASRRKAAVGRIELRTLLLVYALHSALSVVTMSSILQQGGTPLGVLSAVHTGVIVLFFWILLGNALVATQIVEDGTPAALVPLGVIALLFFAPTLYISLDTALGWTNAFDWSGSEPRDLKEIALFVLTLIWPAFAALAYLVIMIYVVVVVLKEKKPALYYLLAGLLFAGAHLVFFLASQPLCEASNRKINGAFLWSLLNSAAMGLVYLAWKAITEDDWGEELGAYY